MRSVTRRAFIASAVATGSVAWSGAWERALALRLPISTAGRYGPLSPPADANGVRLPAGFRSRVVARSGEVVGPTAFRWHGAPDGGACFPAPDGGWAYVSNSERSSGAGGASALRFSADGGVADAYTILSGTNRNCAGGPTPWGTWLSCEENGAASAVWECSPLQPGQGIRRPALGAFNHEAAVVDHATGDVYLTEDHPAGRLYRFVPAVPGDLSTGALFAAAVGPTGPDGFAPVQWLPTPAGRPDRNPATAPFAGGEGAWADGERLLFTTKHDRRVWDLGLRSGHIRVLHDCVAAPATPLDAVDNIVVHGPTGDIYVAEDGGNMQLCSIEEPEPGGPITISAFLQIDGQSGSEIAGPAFSPDGSRLYVSSQRGPDGKGLTYEIRGPFANPTVVQRAPPTGLQRATRLGPPA